MHIYLTQGLHRALQQHPQRTATLCGARRQDWRTLVNRVARLAAVLRAQGVQHGERVALLAHNSDYCVEAFLATWWVGGVVCPLNTRWSRAEMQHALQDVQPRLLLADAALLPGAPALTEHTPVLLLGPGADPAHAGMASTEALLATAQPMEDCRHGGDALAIVLFTGGTTGFPKGVMLSHANLWSATAARLAQLPGTGTSLLATPLFHVAGLGRLVGQIVQGSTCVIETQFRPAQVLRAIAEHGVSEIMLVPSMLQMLLDAPEFDATRLPSLQRIVHGAAPMPQALLLRAMQALPQVEFATAYGMTETSASASLNGPYTLANHGAHLAHLTSVGRASWGSELRITGPDGQALPLGDVGEICVRGPSVMQGYWRQPEATVQVLKDGWMHTGDGGWMDEAGHVHLVDRLKDMIISGGENVYSLEVESALMRHPAVALCAVVGVPDAQWGEAVHAAVVLRPQQPCTPEALREHARTQLSGFKCPRVVHVLDALPLSPTGKILKNRLREQLARLAPDRNP
ncbi:class I adenylate-forming enzyme family protein [Acidovorax soli]|uniref:Long-chain acyl-CoA synthetase n=1 Tax=Acidovorax soli TaxID=592050 RepID=A0A1H3Y0A3_9BURK|nr:AMP-binding protein [Acidovorax soli]SEA04232.1 long-chain acyl-CoA synthetase [Acidovorax soli]